MNGLEICGRLVLTIMAVLAWVVLVPMIDALTRRTRPELV
jgi:hypothetical protein